MTLQLAGPGYYDQLVRSSQDFMRSPSEATFDRLEELLNSKTGVFVGGHKDAVLGKALELIQLPLVGLPRKYIESLSGADVDVSFTVALCLMAKWSETQRQGMLVVHDQSSNMSKQRKEWQKVVSPDVPHTIVGSDRRTMKFPIGVVETKFESDGNWAGIQLADVLAGAMEDVMTAMLPGAAKPEPLTQSLMELFDGYTLAERLWPEPKVTPRELGTVGKKHRDANEFVGRILLSGEPGTAT